MLEFLAGILAARGAPLFIAQEAAPGFLGVSRAAFFRLKASKALPLPVVIQGTEVKYRRSDLERWATKLKSDTRSKRRARNA